MQLQLHKKIVRSFGIESNLEFGNRFNSKFGIESRIWESVQFQMNDHDAIAVANKNRSVTLQMITMQLIAVFTALNTKNTKKILLFYLLLFCLSRKRKGKENLCD